MEHQYQIKEDRIFIEEDNEKKAEITFPKTGKDIYTITHTIVSPSLQGQGIAGELVRRTIEEVKKRNSRLNATCSYALSYLEKHKEEIPSSLIAPLFLLHTTRKISAEDFFSSLKGEKSDLVLDMRIHNQSNLHGFTKEQDISYFTKIILAADYVSDPMFLPSIELRKEYAFKKIKKEEYLEAYKKEMKEKDVVSYFYRTYPEKKHIAILKESEEKDIADILLLLLKEKE